MHRLSMHDRLEWLPGTSCRGKSSACVHWPINNQSHTRVRQIHFADQGSPTHTHTLRMVTEVFSYSVPSSKYTRHAQAVRASCNPFLLIPTTSIASLLPLPSCMRSAILNVSRDPRSLAGPVATLSRFQSTNLSSHSTSISKIAANTLFVLININGALTDTGMEERLTSWHRTERPTHTHTHTLCPIKLCSPPWVSVWFLLRY